ncbi:MAG: McrC family protein [Deltaproteobacteria bacterium]|nr:McrC family protein [Deltaproteobacteria bacterium]
MTGPQVTVREFARLTLDQVRASLDQATITHTAFDYLCELCVRAGSGNGFLQVEDRRTIRLANFVGVVETPCGTRLEILPKHADDGADATKSRALLRRMLSDCLDLEQRSADEASIQLHRLPLTEWIIRRFLGELDALLKRGVRFDYVRLEEEQRYLRGQWDVVRQMRQPPGRDHFLHLRHDVFLPDRPENRLLRSALDRVCRAAAEPDNWRLAHELAIPMSEVPPSANLAGDFRAWRTDRMMANYRAVLPWCRLVLGQEMPLALQGMTRGISMLFPMEKVFERHVAAQLRRQLVPGTRLVVQAESKYLCEHEQRPMFRMVPDLLFARGTAQWVMDTKWKRIHAARRSSNYDLSQADFYQLFAYGHAYLGGHGTMALIYPRTADFDSPLPVFRLQPGLELWALPFDLHAGRLLLPGGATSWPVVVHSAATSTAVKVSATH